MSDKSIRTLSSLLIELVYRVLDHLTPLEISISMRDVTQDLNTIIDTYHRYTVKQPLSCRISSGQGIFNPSFSVSISSHHDIWKLKNSRYVTKKHSKKTIFYLQLNPRI